MRLRDSAVVVRAPLVAGSYGNTSRDWPNATRTTYAVQISAASSTEVIGDEPQVVTQWKLFAGPDLDLEATDRVEWDGDTYEVSGDVMKSRQPGYLHHVRARLRRTTIPDN